VKGEAGKKAPDTIGFRLLENGQQLEWSQKGALKKAMLFRCVANVGE
jgi:hypothetical protein